jgi:hypothetical protein
MMMKKIFIVLMLWSTMLFSLESTYTSQKSFTNDTQEVFNGIKTMLAANDKEVLLIDTTWNSLEAVYRQTKYGILTVAVEEVGYVVEVNATSETKSWKLQIYTQIDDGEKIYTRGDSFEHELFWNRVEYMLGGDGWLECTIASNSAQKHLCKVDKNLLRR